MAKRISHNKRIDLKKIERIRTTLSQKNNCICLNIEKSYETYTKAVAIFDALEDNEIQLMITSSRKVAEKKTFLN